MSRGYAAIFTYCDIYSNQYRIHGSSLKSAYVSLKFIVMTSIELTWRIPYACQYDDEPSWVVWKVPHYRSTGWSLRSVAGNKHKALWMVCVMGDEMCLTPVSLIEVWGGALALRKAPGHRPGLPWLDCSPRQNSRRTLGVRVAISIARSLWSRNVDTTEMIRRSQDVWSMTAGIFSGW
jgi:hypothetical protein